MGDPCLILMYGGFIIVGLVIALPLWLFMGSEHLKKQINSDDEKIINNEHIEHIKIISELKINNKALIGFLIIFNLFFSIIYLYKIQVGFWLCIGTSISLVIFANLLRAFDVKKNSTLLKYSILILSLRIAFRSRHFGINIASGIPNDISPYLTKHQYDIIFISSLAIFMLLQSSSDTFVHKSVL